MLTRGLRQHSGACPKLLIRSLDHAGKIDEIDATCTVEWVLPRVLAKEQIQMMHDRLKTWCGTVDGTLGFLEGEAPELAAA
tara:strand:- start:336 stop:578 length:243 start_codon:yes stop_codon:yes gene_type:complete